MNLIIVESPTKAKTIKHFLKDDYLVKSSYGHIRDLPKKELGVDVEHNFKPKYVIPPKSKKRLKELKTASQKADLIILATDEDREGEAIAWHLLAALELPANLPYQRIVFHEITKSAIKEALKNPRQIKMSLVNAQQARRILDRLVGYELSPFLWKKVVKGLSAGRVQSVTVRLIVEREREIEVFQPEEYWSVLAELTKKKDKKIFTAQLKKKEGKNIPKLGLKNKKEVEQILKELKKSDYQVEDVQKKEVLRNPYPPFTTSTLQQEAWRRFGFSAKQTMFLAQQLYEGISLDSLGSVGLITYMRTDSFNLSEDALGTAQKFITNKFGQKYAQKRLYRTKSKRAQEAHEAIRPANPAREPEQIEKFLDQKQAKLYSLIWKRMIASQMASASLDSTIIDIKAKDCIFRATGSVIKFDGFMKVYPLKMKETILPDLKLNEKLKLFKLTSQQHFTQPPPRYTEASLVKALEDEGIGRPSTYAPIMSTIQERGYVEKQTDKCFHPKEIGILVNDLLVKHFPRIVDIKFTAQMEENLDKIAAGQEKWKQVVKSFYQPFKENLMKKYDQVDKKELTEEKTKEICEKCDQPMIIKMGRFGKFLACTGYPECKNTKPLENQELAEKAEKEKCEKCGAPMKLKQGKFGPFLGCSSYPQCKNVKNIEKSTGVKCPQCQKGEIVERKTRRGKTFYSCNRYPECDYATWQKPENNSDQK
ncbi:MAG TPA: type I DNA topoisomerase [Candidatus Portnoybacteria bacterium]|nr:type I DNA topoisomerase [Candidatus Portnoybacteria bacterium]